MKVWIRLAIKEITNNRRFSLLFIVNLSIGLMGFIALNSFNNSLHVYFEDNLKKILTADFLVSSSSAFSEEENAILDKLTGRYKKESRQISFLSMAASPGYSRLARIIAIDSNYPLYGQILLQGDRKSDPEIIRSDLMNKAGVWMSPNTAVSLGTEVGETIKIGQKDFHAADFVIEDPEGAITGFEMAPRLYIGLDQLEGTGLLKFGSRANYVIYYKYPTGIDVKSITDKITEAFNGKSDRASHIEVIDRDRVIRRVGRAVDHFTGYMGLIGLVALLLSGIGAGYLFRSYLDKNLRQIAILMSLGASRFEAYIMFFAQVIQLGMISSIVASILSFLLLPVFPKIFHGLLPSDLSVKADFKSLLLAIVLGIIGSIIFCLPVIIKLHQLKPLNLLKGDSPANKGSRALFCRQSVALLPALFFFWILATDQVNSIVNGTIFLGGFFFAALALGLAGRLLMVGSRKLSHSRNILMKISFRNIYRNKFTSVLCFLTIALGTYLLNIGPQIKNGLEQEVIRPKGLQVPSFFLIDIQPEQVGSLDNFLKIKNHRLTNVSPLISGDINSINGVDFNQWVNKIRGARNERGPRSTDREFNFSYRNGLDISESITHGKPLTAKEYEFNSGRPAEISIAEDFADRYRLDIEDILEFDIQGIPVFGRVVNIRDVRWNSFQPNFFILFQPGVLEDAPKIFLASIPQMEKEKKLPLQNAMVAKFPNVLMIDVGRMVENVLAITDRISFSMKLMAYLSVIAGLIVIFSIARQETHSRLWEINLLKILGAGFRDIRAIIIFEFGILGFVASSVAVILSIISSYAISYYYFERLWSLRIEYNILSILAVSVICALTALAAAGKIIRQKPLAILQAA